MTTHTRTPTRNPTRNPRGSDQGPPHAGADTDPAIELDRLTVRYPGADHFALHDVGVSVARGDVLAIVGPSGCGKSTLLKVVAGLLPPSIGTVHLDGVDAASLPVERRRTGWVPQSYALFDHLDVTGNVAFGLRAACIAPDRQRARIDEVLRLCRITELANRSVVELSGGQRQRVAIARALAPEPKVLLLDEPLGALDPQLRADLRTELAILLRTTGVTTLIVTHDQDEALAIADQVLVLRDGQIEQHGTPVQLWQHPATAFVANFVSGATTCRATIRDGRAVITPGLHLPVTAHGLTDGTYVEIAVRPNALNLQEPGAPATVIGCEFQAGRWSITVEPTDVPGLQLRATATHPVTLGDTVSIAARADATAPIIPPTSGPTRPKDAP